MYFHTDGILMDHSIKGNICTSITSFSSVIINTCLLIVSCGSKKTDAALFHQPVAIYLQLLICGMIQHWVCQMGDFMMYCVKYMYMNIECEKNHSVKKSKIYASHNDQVYLWQWFCLLIFERQGTAVLVCVWKTPNIECIINHCADLHNYYQISA